MPLTVELKTLTPIWTGDVDRDSPRLRETGLLGGLRWWYEGLLRAHGQPACDAADGGCKKEPCEACRLFGCTGRSRAFLLRADEAGAVMPLFLVSNRAMERAQAGWLRRIYPRDAHVFWSLRFRLCAIPRRTGHSTDDVEARLALLFKLVCRFGCLGAKGHNGFGQVQQANEPSLKPLVAQAKALFSSGNSTADDRFFSLRNFFHIEFQLADAEPYRDARAVVGRPQDAFRAGPQEYRKYFIPCAFDIRYKSSSSWGGGAGDFGMRPLFRRKFGPACDMLLGNSRARDDDLRSASRVYVSHLFRREPGGAFGLNIFGDVPPSTRLAPQDVASVIRDFIQGRDGMFPGSTSTIRYWTDIWENGL